MRMRLPFTKVGLKIDFWLDKLIEAFHQRFLIFFLIGVIAVCANEIYLFGPNVLKWDPMYISSVFTFIIGLRLAVNLPHLVEDTLLRLKNCGSLRMNDDQFRGLKAKIETNAKIYAKWTGLIASIFMLLAFGIAFGPYRALWVQSYFTLFAMAGAYIAGLFLGRSICYSRLGRFIRKEHITVDIQPGHLDGAAGLKPVGDLFFYQAMLLAIPALFLAVWWVLIPALERYLYWRSPYLVLLALVLTIEILAFILPMLSFHHEMQSRKRKLLVVADQISLDFTKGQEELVRLESDDERKKLKGKLDLMTDRYAAIQNMPTWPVDTKIRRWFVINNIALFLPLLTRFITVPDFWQKILDDFQNILKNLPS